MNITNHLQQRVYSHKRLVPIISVLLLNSCNLVLEKMSGSELLCEIRNFIDALLNLVRHLADNENTMPFKIELTTLEQLVNESSLG